MCVLQAVYAAFARFRAHHVLSPGKRKTPEQASLPPPEAQAEADAVNMLQHVSHTVSQPTTPSQLTSSDTAQQATEQESQQPGTTQQYSNEVASPPPNNGQTGDASPGVQMCREQ